MKNVLVVALNETAQMELASVTGLFCLLSKNNAWKWWLSALGSLQEIDPSIIKVPSLHYEIWEVSNGELCRLNWVDCYKLWLDQKETQ